MSWVWVRRGWGDHPLLRPLPMCGGPSCKAGQYARYVPGACCEYECADSTGLFEFVLLGGLGDWANFVLGGKLFFKNFSSIEYRVFITKCTDFKNQCWPMVKIFPEIIIFLGFLLPRKSKILPKIKICPISLKIYPKTQNLPSHRVPPFITSNNRKTGVNVVA